MSGNCAPGALRTGGRPSVVSGGASGAGGLAAAGGSSGKGPGNTFGIAGAGLAATVAGASLAAFRLGISAAESASISAALSPIRSADLPVSDLPVSDLPASDCAVLLAVLPNSMRFEAICAAPMTMAMTLAATNSDFTRRISRSRTVEPAPSCGVK